MMQKREITISSKKQIIDLLNLKRAARKIVLELPCLSESQNIKYQNLLNRYYTDCGCQFGSITAVVATFLIVLFMIMKNTTLIEWSSFFVLIAVFFLSAGIGKAIGILRAKLMFRYYLREIYSILPS